MTIFVTGGSGFVGSAIVRALLSQGERVRVLVRPKSDIRNLENLDIDFVKGDITDKNSLREGMKDCFGVFHVAALYRLWIPQPEVFYRTNVTGTVNVLTQAVHSGVERIVYTSSVATLKAGTGEITDEQTPVSLEDMVGHYKRSKFLAEQEVRHLVDDQQFPVVIVNPSTPVGPRDNKPTPTGRLLLDAAKGKMPVCVDTGLNIVHVDDVAQGHILAFKHGRIGERYILGGENIALKELLLRITALTGQRAPRFLFPPQIFLPLALLSEAWARLFSIENPFITVDGVRMSLKKMYFSSHKAEQHLGYVHRPLDQALHDAITWYRDHGYLPKIQP